MQLRSTDRYEHARDLDHPAAPPEEDKTLLKRLLGRLPPIDDRLLFFTAVRIHRSAST